MKQTPLPPNAIEISRPPLIMDVALIDRLRSVAQSALRSAPDVATRLLEEIDRAETRPAADLPADVVTLGSRVTYQDRKSGSIRTLYLVLPAHADPSSQRYSVVSPVGAALIGLSVNHMMGWHTPEGGHRELTVLAVCNEAASRPGPP
jgi:regulator of nucleoside diphosphate kinase